MVRPGDAPMPLIGVLNTSVMKNCYRIKNARSLCDDCPKRF